MEDNGNYIYYLVLGAIYVISKLLGKKKKKPTAVPRKKRNIVPPTSGSDEAPPISFEDILRELSGAKQAKPEPLPEPALTETATFKPIPEDTYSNDGMDEIAVEYNVPKAVGAEHKPTPEIERKKLTFERMGQFTIEEEEKVDYLEGLSDQNGAAKAFVMSEIFARKYQ
jgi:hypothetical protein